MIAIQEVSTFSKIPNFVPFGVLYYTQDTSDLYIGTGTSVGPAVMAVAGGGGGTPGGDTGQVQINIDGAFAGQDAGGGYMSFGTDVPDGFLVTDDAEENYIQAGASNNGLSINASPSMSIKIAGGASLALGLGQSFNLDSGGQAGLQTNGDSSGVIVEGSLQLSGELFDGGDSSGSSGQPLTSTGTAVAWAFLPWNVAGNATGNLSLSNAGYTSTFNQTSAVAWLWANTTASTLDANVSSPLLEVAGTYYGAAGGSLAASAADTWSIQNVLGTGSQNSGSAQLTHFAESAGSVVTITLASPSVTPVVGQVWVFTGLSTGSWIDGYAVTLLSASPTTCTFNDPTAHGVQSSTVLTGTPVMTRVDNLSTLTFSHTGSPVAGSIAFPTATNVTIGTANSIAGTLTLSSASSANQVVLANSTGSTLVLTGSGTVNVSAPSGLALIGSSSTELTLVNGSTWTTGTGGNINIAPSSNVSALTLANTTAATVSQSQSTSILIGGKYWSGSSAVDTWTVENTLSNGLNAASTLTIAHTAGTTGLATIQLNAHVGSTNSDVVGSLSSAPSGIVAATVVVAAGAATATFTVTSTEGFTVGDTVTLSSSGWTGGSGLASSTATVTSVASTTSMVLTRASGGPWVAGTYSSQTGTLAQTGGTTVSFIYATAYANTPVVVVTPTSSCGAFYLSASTTTGFTITYANSGTQTFNYQVIGTPN